MAFSWTTPVTNREDGTAMMTYTDMIRITRNIGYLQEQLYTTATISKTSWSSDDIIYKTFWAELIAALNAMSTDTGAPTRDISDEMTFDNINEVERWELDIYNAIRGVTYAPLQDHNLDDITDADLDPITVPIY